MKQGVLMLYEMSLNQASFKKIKSGTKTAEIRLLDEKRKNLRIGDEIKFFKLPERKESVVVMVKKLSTFSSFKEMFEKIDKKYLGHENMTLEQQLERIYNIYTKEEEERLGVLAIFIELI